MTFLKKHKNSLLTALAAGIGYGGWAVYANFEHGTHAWLMAGIVQAIYAFLSTLTVTHCARLVFLKFKCGIRGVATGFVASFILMLIIPITVHASIGTPDIWQTITPGLIWGGIYLMSFLISLNIQQKRN